jgi:hypothetical protein
MRFAHFPKRLDFENFVRTAVRQEAYRDRAADGPY